MDKLNFEKIHNEFDLEDFLLQPVGKFTKADLKLIYKAKKKHQKHSNPCKNDGF